MANAQRLRGVYGKPLTRAQEPLTDKPDNRDVLRATGKLAVAQIRAEIGRLTFKRPATQLAKSFSYRIEGKSTLVIESSHPAAQYLNKGVRKHQMTYLTKALRPIPILRDDGTLIFRNATPKSMREGKWIHPGFKGKHFLDRGVARAREMVKNMVASDIKKRVRARAPKG